MSNVKQSLKMILEGSFSDDILDQLHLHESECEKLFSESYDAAESVKSQINKLENMLSHNQRLEQEVKSKTWKFKNPEAELEKLHKQADRLKHWLEVEKGKVYNF